VRVEAPEPMARLRPQVHQDMRSLTVLQFW